MGAYEVFFHIVLTSIHVNYRFYGPNKYIIKIVAAIEFQCQYLNLINVQHGCASSTILFTLLSVFVVMDYRDGSESPARTHHSAAMRKPFRGAICSSKANSASARFFRAYFNPPRS